MRRSHSKRSCGSCRSDRRRPEPTPKPRREDGRGAAPTASRSTSSQVGTYAGVRASRLAALRARGAITLGSRRSARANRQQKAGPAPKSVRRKLLASRAERVGVVPGLGRAWSAGPALPAYSSQPSHARSAAFGCRELHGRRAGRSFPPGSVRAGPPMRGRALGVSARTECDCAACHHRRTARVVTHVASSPNPAYGRPTSPLEGRVLSSGVRG
jgi:hypothetical protein